MSLWSLVRRSLGFYWRTNIAVLLTAVVTTAVLTGALAVGDSVRYSLKMMVRARLGATQLALVPQNRFFTAGLAADLATDLDTAVAPVLQLRGLVANSAGTSRANRVEVLGVDERFYEIGAATDPFGEDAGERVVLNSPLAARLGVGVGDEVVLRVDRPDRMPRDVPLTPDADLSIAARLTVRAIAADSQFGRFSLQANQVAALNAFVPIQWLQEKLDRAGQANMLLVAANPADSVTLTAANEALRKRWQLSDAGLELRQLERQGVLEIRSRRVFIDQSVSDAALKIGDDAVGVLAYFVNELRSGEKATPYSMVAAMAPSGQAGAVVTTSMRDDEIVINQWLADDIEAGVGDSIEVTYFALGPMRKLEERKAGFRVLKILPMEQPAVDPELMPDFPGLADADNCRDWEPGIPIDLDKIRDRDEDYWDRYRGTPKAFITLEAGRELWSNRYGNLTAVRYPLGNHSRESVEKSLSQAVDPASVGLFLQPVRQRGLQAGDQATDFGQLFLGLSMFLVLSALILMALVFVFGVESRGRQIGMLLAVGFSPRLVRGLFFIEGGVLAVLGAIAGAGGGLIYTKAMIYGLATLWRGAVAGSEILFHAEPVTLLIGTLSGILVALIAIRLALRKQASRPARELLSGIAEEQFLAVARAGRRRRGLWVALASIAAAAVLLVLFGASSSRAVSAAFFGIGVLVLIAGIGLGHTLLAAGHFGHTRPVVSLSGLGLRNAMRRRGRSLALAGLLACGIFLVISVAANRHDPLAGSDRRDSGTGGFSLFGESAIGFLQDLNGESTRQSMGLADHLPDDVSVVQLKVHDGDDASCFNLNRAQRPRLLGVEPEKLLTRGAFGFADVADKSRLKEAWSLLDLDLGENVVPAVGDYPTVVWALGKSLGDDLEYVDEKGQTFRLRLVGMINGSILQGSLLISAPQFTKRYPSEDGYRMYLIDTPEDTAAEAAEKLSFAMRDFGLALVPAKQRLADFSTVEHTYLSIFQMLGGLGLVLGSIGLGLVVLRNLLDRRGELGMLRAVGFDKATLARVVFYEHWGLMLYGLACGSAAALMAVGPALRSGGSRVPYLSLATMVLAIALSGALWVWLAAKVAMGPKILEALRSE
ncbi:MAG: ABC transporter permease [Phycisphaerales bacterium]|nr:MAG: ABC transporter permease [Phycisphaerales bacterium]